MRLLCDYRFYAEEFCGRAISQEEFDNLAVRATAFILSITGEAAAFGKRMTCAQMAMCAAAEALRAFNAGGGDNMIEQESLGSRSVRYYKKRDADSVMFSAARPYLARAGLLYSGVGLC